MMANKIFIPEYLAVNLKLLFVFQNSSQQSRFGRGEVDRFDQTNKNICDSAGCSRVSHPVSRVALVISEAGLRFTGTALDVGGPCVETFG